MARKEEKLNYPALARALDAEGPRRLYLLWGPEAYLREAFLEALKGRCLPEGADDFSYKRMDGPSVDMRELSDAVNALPFMSERTLIEVRSFDLNKCREADAAELEKIVSDIPEYCTLAFVQNSDYEVDWRLKAAKSIKKYGETVKFTSQDEGQLVLWIRKRFAALDKAVDTPTAMHLVYTSGDLMSGLIPEIEKIAASAPGDRITKDDVEKFAHHVPEARVFEMTDRLAEKDYDGAARLLGELLASGEEPIMTLAVIGQQMRRLYAARVAAEDGLGVGFVSEVCGIKYESIAARLVSSARRFTLPQLRRAVELCAETDYAMKSSGADNEDLLRELFVRLAAEGRA